MYWTAGPLWTSVLLASALLLPVWLTFRFRQFALSTPGEDRTVVWFGFMRSLRTTLFAAMALWWAVTDLTRLQYYTLEVNHFFGLVGTTVGDVVSLLLVWAPMLLILVVCSVISQPVYASVRGLAWTRAELAKLSVLRLGVTYIPLLIFVAGLRRSFSADAGISSYLFCFAGATGVFLVSLRYLRAAMHWRPEALTVGELRDRVFALAKKARVNLRQIYVLPAGKMRMANAFASSANTILLTDYLLSQLNRREVDSIVAHELGHLKHKHAQLRGVLTGIIGFGIAFWYTSAVRSPYLPVIDIVLAFVPLCGLYFLSRKLEFTADAEGVKLTGDPEALISGLAKTHNLNLLPVHWGRWHEKMLTHPSTVRRAQAIARRAGMPVERVPKILETALAMSGRSADASERYALPQNTQSSDKIFSTEFKRRTYWRAYLPILGAMTILPAIVVWGIRLLALPMQGWFVLGASFLPAAFLCLVVANFAPSIGYQAIQQQLRRKIENEGAPQVTSNALFVGLSPGPNPRLYEASCSWDVGYLFFARDLLAYWGEETRFALRKDQIISVRVGPGVPAWIRAPIIYITWHNTAKETDETLGLLPGRVHSLLEWSKIVDLIVRRLESWRSGELMVDVPSDAIVDLPPPAFGDITGMPIGRMKLRSVFVVLLIVGFLAGCVSSLIGLPVDVTTFIARTFNLSDRDCGDSWGWYAVISAWLVAIFYYAPLLVYRNPAAASQRRLRTQQAAGCGKAD